MTLSLVPYDQKNTQPSFRYFGADEQLHSFEHRRWNVLVAGKSGVLFWEATIGTVSNVVLCMTTIPESFAFAAFRTAAFYPLFGFVSASLLRTALKRVVQVAVEPTAVPSTLRGFLPDEPDRDSPLSLADAAAEISRYPKIEPPSNVIAFRIPSRPRT